MQSTLLQYYKDGDISLMKQFLLTVPIFNEIHYYLNADKFKEFIESIQVHELEYCVPYQLNSRSTYLFMCTGILLSKKQKKQNYQKLSRLSKTIRFSQIILSRDELSQKNQRQSERVKNIDLYQLYNQHLLYNPNFVGNNQYFLSNEERKSAIIQLNFSNVPENIILDITQRHNQKLKFIATSNTFKNVQRNLIQDELEKFQILKVSFDQYLFKCPSLRANHIFFLTSGEVQIFTENKQDKKSYITKAPAIIGFQSIKYAKSVTESCFCYYTQKNQVASILKKSMDGKFKNSETEEQLKKIMKSLGKQISMFNTQNSLAEITPIIISVQESLTRNQRLNTTPASPINLQNQHSSFKQKQSIIKPINQKFNQNKKFRIKQHFTNFLNDKYAQFNIKKAQFLKKKTQNQDSVLYQMKFLISKEPQMSQINQKLKIQRLKKIQRCKQNILSTKQQRPNSINLRIYEQFQDNRIVSKIRRKIEHSVQKKQIKKLNWKTYVPNSSSFNRMSDLLIGG